MAKKVIRAFAPDVGKVLINYSQIKAFKAVAPYTTPTLTWEEVRAAVFGTPSFGEVELSSIQNRHETGLTTERKYFDEVQAAIGLNGFGFATFRKLWSDIWIDPTMPGVEELLSRVRSDVKLCLVSNNAPVYWNALQDFPVMQRFFGSSEKRVLSFEVGVRKPGAAMFHAIPQKTGVPPEETLFVDDIPEYVEAARKLGFNAEQYNCSVDPFLKFEAILAAYGLLA